MASPTTVANERSHLRVRPLVDDIPILYEDEEEDDMGDSNPHTLSSEVLHLCLKFHMAAYHPSCEVYLNMNLYYRDRPLHPKTKSQPYVSPDVMIVKPFHPLSPKIKSYKIGRDGPPPLFTNEVLSERSAQQRDLKEKMVVYAKLGVSEYLLVDETGDFLPEKLLLKRLHKDGTYKDVKDPDGGVTSQLGFRVILEEDGLRVIDLATGIPYARPMEAEKEARARRLAVELFRAEEEARQRAEKKAQAREKARRKAQAERRAAEEKLRALEEELSRLRQQQQKPLDLVGTKAINP